MRGERLPLLAGISMELPAMVRLQKDAECLIKARIQNASKAARGVRLGLVFPSEFTSPDEDLQVVLPEGSEFSTLAWRCTPGGRGQ